MSKVRGPRPLPRFSPPPHLPDRNHEATANAIERVEKTIVNSTIVYDQRILKVRATELSKHSRRRGCYGKIPMEDLWLKMELQHWQCMYCKDRITFFNCHFDHVWPVARGGETYLYNIALTCSTCNSAKGTTTLQRFCQKMRFDFDSIVQELAEINRKLHDLVDWNDESEGD